MIKAAFDAESDDVATVSRRARDPRRMAPDGSVLPGLTMGCTLAGESTWNPTRAGNGSTVSNKTRRQR